jgi:hypothetical protein
MEEAEEWKYKVFIPSIHFHNIYPTLRDFGLIDVHDDADYQTSFLACHRSFFQAENTLTF